MFQLYTGSDPDGVRYRRPKGNKRLQISGNLTWRKARVNTRRFIIIFLFLPVCIFYKN